MKVFQWWKIFSLQYKLVRILFVFLSWLTQGRQNDTKFMIFSLPQFCGPHQTAHCCVARFLTHIRYTLALFSFLTVASVCVFVSSCILFVWRNAVKDRLCLDSAWKNTCIPYLIDWTPRRLLISETSLVRHLFEGSVHSRAAFNRINTVLVKGRFSYTGVEECRAWWHMPYPVIHFYLVVVNECTESLEYLAI